MKKAIILTAFIFIAASFVHAQYDDYPDSNYSNGNVRFFWSIGDIGISWDNVAGSYRTLASMKIANLNWMVWPGFGWGFNLFSFEGTSDWSQVLIFPVEASFSPFGYRSDGLLLSLYGRGGLMMQMANTAETSFWDRTRFFGAAGLRFAWFPAPGKNWSIFTGAFVEYTTKRELRIGLSVDLTIIAAIWLLSTTN